MKSITIHGIDELTSRQLTQLSEEMGLSLNKTIKKILQEALGITSPEISSGREDFGEFCGLWSTVDLDRFNKETKPLRQIDSGDWE